MLNVNYSLCNHSEPPACALRSSLLVCEYKGTTIYALFQISPLCASTYVNLCELMSTYARYLDVFLAKRSFILYLCSAFN